MRSDLMRWALAVGLCGASVACATGQESGASLPSGSGSNGLAADPAVLAPTPTPTAGGSPAAPVLNPPATDSPTGDVLSPVDPSGQVAAPDSGSQLPTLTPAPAQPAAPAEPGDVSEPTPDPTPATGAPFPRAEAPVNVGLSGPYQFAQEAVTDPDWESATLYYPTDAPAPHAIMLVSPGFTETKEQMSWWAEMLVSHGFVVLSTTPLNTLADQPPDRGTDLQTALARIRAEQTRAGSPVAGKLALDRIALSGHSMGGGGSVWAASREGANVRAAIPLMPHTPFIADADMKKITAATLYIAGELDPDLLGSPVKYAIPHFQSMTPTVERAVMVFRGGDHFIGVNGGQFHDVVARYSVAWLKIHLEDDDRYRTYVYGADHDPAPFSTYMTAP